MIKTWEELSNEIAEIKIDIAYLMNSQPNLTAIKDDIELIKKQLANLVQPEWTTSQWDVVTQLASEVRSWRKKHADLQLEVFKLRTAKKGFKDYEVK